MKKNLFYKYFVLKYYNLVNFIKVCKQDLFIYNL